MKRFKNILLVLPADTSSGGAIEVADKLARDNAAQITLIDVVPNLGTRIIFPGGAAKRKKVQKALIDQRKDELRTLGERTLGSDLRTRIKVASGTVFIEIIRQVLRDKHDMVIKPAEGESRARIFGSTDMHLMRKCPCPVWVLKSGKRADIKKVLAAVDPVGPEQRKLSAKVVDLAGTLCAREGASLHVVHAWNFPHEDALRSRNIMSESDISNIRIEIQEGHGHEVQKLLNRKSVKGLNPKLHLVEGSPAKTIPSLANSEAVDVVVMGTVGRTGVAGLFVGNTAERVLNNVGCSVLAVKPDGFETPVEA